jgi:glycolate oxidase iron-sulfur subunit
MKTAFRPAQLADPATASSEAIIRNCVHCGFCNATCPTYLLLGDERDGPRGRIYLIKNMLENGRRPTQEVVEPLDRCLSCLSCVTTCPSDVDYGHLIDHARDYIERRYRRPLYDRMLRACLAFVLPHPSRFRMALAGARAFKALLPRWRALPLPKSLIAMLELAPAKTPRAAPVAETPIAAPSRGRVILAQNCIEGVLQPRIREAAMRVLRRAGYDIVTTHTERCCGALMHHMGREADARASARRNIDAWMPDIEKGGLDAIITTAAGCGTALKNYGFLLRDDPQYTRKAATVSALARDISEMLAPCPPAGSHAIRRCTVAYHSACSLQHGQKVHETPRQLLAGAGFVVKDIAEGHLCCGSAGVYNILQPDIAQKLRRRKADHIDKVAPDIVATGNIGCIAQLSGAVRAPVVHTVELLDWAQGGPPPAGCEPFERPAEVATRS